MALDVNPNVPHLPPASSPEFVNGTPDWVKDIISKASQQYDVPTMVLSALLKQESGFSPTAQSPVGAQGIAQFMPETAKGMGINPLDPESAIMGAAKYLRSGIDKFGDVKLALAAYNAGTGAVEHYQGIPPYAETQNYVKNIMSMAGEPHQSANGPYLDLMNNLKKDSSQNSSLPGGSPTPASSPITPSTPPPPPMANGQVPQIPEVQSAMRQPSNGLPPIPPVGEGVSGGNMNSQGGLPPIPPVGEGR